MSDHHNKSSKGIRKGALLFMMMMAIWMIVSVALAIILNHPTNLEHWKQLSNRPGFTLIDSVETSDCYICVYDTGRDEIAFCVRGKTLRMEPPRAMLEIEQYQGADACDSNRSQTTNLAWERSYCFVKYAGRDGMVYPIKKEITGPLHIRYAASGKDQIFNLAYDKQIEWNSAAKRR